MAELIEKMLQEFDSGNMEAVNKILEITKKAICAP